MLGDRLYLLVVRDLAHQHFGDLSRNIAIVIHLSLPENCDVCPHPVHSKVSPLLPVQCISPSQP